MIIFQKREKVPDSARRHCETKKSPQTRNGDRSPITSSILRANAFCGSPKTYTHVISPTNFNNIVKKSCKKNKRRCQANQSFGVFEHFACSCVHDFSLIVAPNLSLQARSVAAWLERIELTPIPVKGTHKGQRMIG